MAKRPQRDGKRWTGEEAQQLQELVKRNTPTRVIAQKMKRSESAIKSKAQASGIGLGALNTPPRGTRGKRKPRK